MKCPICKRTIEKKSYSGKKVICQGCFRNRRDIESYLKLLKDIRKCNQK